MLKKIMYYIIAVIAIVAFLVFYAKHFERSNIYFPSRSMEATPASIPLEYEDVYFETSDGVKLNGWFIPSDRARGTILYCHGNAGNISHRLDTIRMFNSLAFNVFIFDYRGYGKSRGRPSEEGTYLDALAAYNYLLSRKDIDRKKIVIYGKSLGGAVAIDLAAKVDACAVISDSTFTSTMDMAKEIFPFLPVKLVITMKYDTFSKIGEVDTPKLIIHSEEDEIVPFQHGEKLFMKAGEPKKLYRMRGGHNDGFIMYEERFKKGISEFLKEIGL